MMSERKLLLIPVGVAGIVSAIFPICLATGQQFIAIATLVGVVITAGAIWKVGRERRRLWTECIFSGTLLGGLLGSLVINLILGIYFALNRGLFGAGFGVPLFIAGICLPSLITFLQSLAGIQDDLRLLVEDRDLLQKKTHTTTELPDSMDVLKDKIKDKIIAFESVLDTLDAPSIPVEQLIAKELFWQRLYEASIYWLIGFSTLAFQFIAGFQTVSVWVVLVFPLVCALLTWAGFRLINQLCIKNAIGRSPNELELLLKSYRAEVVAEIDQLKFELNRLRQ